MRMPSSRHCWGPNVYPEVPEGGWGWAVAAAFFMVEVCTYGTIKSLGVFLQDLMDEYGESNSRVSWIISICVFIFSFTAPVATMLSNRFGHRPVVMMGGFLISLGTCSSAFTNSINDMYITIGIISGFGYCLAFIPTVTILAQYFSRRRALVTSIASTGECVAIFAFAPALTALKAHIGWRYCLLVLGVSQASVIGCGMLLRPITIRPGPAAKGEDAGTDAEKLSLKRLEAAYRLESEQSKGSVSSGASQGSQDSGVTSLSASNVELRAAGLEEKAAALEPLSSPPTPVKEDLQERETRSKESMLGAESEAGPLPPSAAKLLDFSVLRDAAFIWYSLFGLFATLGFFAPQLYVIELSKSRGVAPATASYMLSAMAVAEFLGRLSIGMLLNRVRRRKTLVLLTCVALLCAVLLAFTAAHDFWGLAACSALYGFFLGTVASTHIPLLAEEEVVGVQRMASSVGVYVSIQSFAGLAGPPLGGWLVDVTQNYGSAFYSCAAGMGLGALCLAMVAPAKSGLCRRRRRRRGGGGGEQEGETSAAQDNEQPDFLEVDFVPESSPAKQQQQQQAAVEAAGRTGPGAGPPAVI
ncbi:solute carrier family 16 member 6b isoform X2 [Nelusetta ayraudi]